MFNETLRKERKNQNINGREMADLLGLKTIAAYYKKEAGSISFSASEAILIANRLGKTVEQLFCADQLSKIENQ